MALLDKFKKKEDKPKKEETKEVKKDTSVVKSAPTKDDAIAGVHQKNYGILKDPYITEKSSMLGVYNQYVFKVVKEANKIDVKNAVENIFGVKVLNVAMLNMPGKKVRLGAHTGRRKGFKKAVVTLKQGDKIDIGI